MANEPKGPTRNIGNISFLVIVGNTEPLAIRRGAAKGQHTAEQKVGVFFELFQKTSQKEVEDCSWQ